MNAAKPAPLFWPSLALGAGMGWAIRFPSPTWLYLALAAPAVLGWYGALRFGRSEKYGFAALLVFAALCGAYAASVRINAIPPHDLRLMPESVYSDPDAVWSGTVESEPRYEPGVGRREARTVFNFEANSCRLRDADHPAEGLIHAVVRDAGASAFQIGDRISLTGSLDPARPPANPGQFDEAAQLARQQIYFIYRGEATATHLMARGRWGVIGLAGWAHAWAAEKLRMGLEDDPQSTALLSAILLGDRSQLPPEIDDAFQRTSTAHVFAVSGQKVAVIAAVWLFLLERLGFLRWRWGVALLPPLAFYCLMTGGHTSSTRAFLALTLAMVAWSYRRPVPTLNLWAVAFSAVLVYRPALLTEMGFQLTFGVVLAIILLTPRFFRWFRRAAARDPFLPASLATPGQRTAWKTADIAAMALATSCAAWLGAAPLMYYHFHQVSAIGLPANLLVVPLTGLIVITGSISLGFGIFSNALAAAFNNANWLFAKILLWLVVEFARVPGGNFYVPAPGVNWRPSEPELIVLYDRGGPVMLARYRDQAWLVNLGNAAEVNEIVLPALRYYGINRLDGVFLTELAQGFAGGAPDLGRLVPTRTWIVPTDTKPVVLGLKQWVQERRQTPGSVLEWHEGDRHDFGGGFTVEALAPPPGIVSRRFEDHALVLLFKNGAASLLWAGPCGIGREREIAARHPELRAEVLAQSVLAYETGFSEAWLGQLRPGEVILATSFRAPGDPSGFVRERASQEAPPRLWWQEETGAVFVKLDPSGARLRGQLSDQNTSPAVTR